MFILTLCLCITAWLPFLSKIPLGIAMQRAGGYDNHHPREQQQRLIGFGARALAAHQNSFEALTLFATAALTAIATQQVSWLIDLLAVIFVCARLVYHVVYLLDLATLRSLVWFIGFGCCMSMLALSISF